MKTNSHIEAVRTALKKAAKDAVSGTREQRSGRFIPATEAQSKAGSALAQHNQKRR